MPGRREREPGWEGDRVTPEQKERGRAIARDVTALWDAWETWLTEVGQEGFGVGGGSLKTASEDIAYDVDSVIDLEEENFG